MEEKDAVPQVDSAQRELSAMGAVAAAIRGLEPDAIKRVLDWTVNHFLGPSTMVGKTGASGVLGKPAEEPKGDREFEDFPTMLGSANAQTGLDRTILVAYFLQIVLGNSDFDAFSANRELRHAGHVSGNITRDLDALQSRSPQIIIQTRKHGNTKQARKLYKLTSAGITAAREMLGGKAS